MDELPRNVGAECGLLGAVLVDNAAYEEVVDIVQPHQFALTPHARIFEAAGKLIDRGEVANAVTLRAYFEHEDSLGDLDGADYLRRLQDGAINVINAKEYARIIVEADKRRHLIYVAEELRARAIKFDIDEPADTLIEEAENNLFHIGEGMAVEEAKATSFDAAVKLAMQNAETAYKNQGKVIGLSCGFPDIDWRFGGFRSQNLYIIAGRPSMGKTALALAMARNMAVAGEPVAFFSLEMSREQLAQRLIADRANISTHDIDTGSLDAAGLADLAEAAREIRDIPLHIDDGAPVTVSQLRTRARRLKRKHHIKAVFVDYLQLCEAGGKTRSITEDATKVSRGLKMLAKDLDVPVIALSQLSRNVENREDKRPHLADLRESGAIEQDADAVAFVYREQYYLEKAEPKQRADEEDENFARRYTNWEARMVKAQNRAEIIVAKQRHGPTGLVRMTFIDKFARFASWAPDHADERG